MSCRSPESIPQSAVFVKENHAFAGKFTHVTVDESSHPQCGGKQAGKAMLTYTMLKRVLLSINIYESSKSRVRACRDAWTQKKRTSGSAQRLFLIPARSDPKSRHLEIMTQKQKRLYYQSFCCFQFRSGTLARAYAEKWGLTSQLFLFCFPILLLIFYLIFKTMLIINYRGSL